MEQIANYFEALDYVSFGAVALPCVVIAYAVYGILQVVSGKQSKSKFYQDGATYLEGWSGGGAKQTKPANRELNLFHFPRSTFPRSRKKKDSCLILEQVAGRR